MTATPSKSVVAPTYGNTSSAAKSTSSAAACPAPGTTAADGRYSCNPAHSYPTGQVCSLVDGCYYLRTETPGVYATPSATVSLGTPVYFTSTSSAPKSSASCPAAGSTDSQGRYSCNPAHAYPNGQTCELTSGCYFLKYPSTSVSVDVPVYRTTTVSAITTYCPQPTTFVHSASTYVVTKATTLTVPCPGGCVVTSVESKTVPATTAPATTAPATTAPGTTAPVYKTGSTLVPSASKNGTATHTIATYTGAGAIATGAPLAAMAALGAFFL